MYGKKIKMLRQNLGLTQAELAHRLEISSAALSKIESNLTNPSAETTSKLIAAFDVNLNWLYNNQGNMFNESAPADTLQEVNERPYRDSPAQRANYQLLLKLSDTQEKLIEQIEENKRMRSQFVGWLQKMEQSGIADEPLLKLLRQALDDLRNNAAEV